MNSLNAKLLIGWFVCMMFSGCGSHDATSIAAEAPAPIAEDIREGNAVDARRVPNPTEPAVNIRQRASSWVDLLNQLPPHEKALLVEFAQRYHGSVTYADAMERDLLAKQGFPTPEEWLEFNSMSEAELDEKAKMGDSKAAMALVDRMSLQLEAAQIGRRPGDPPKGMSESEIVNRGALVLTRASNLMRTSDSPFAAYVYGRALSAATLGAPPEPIAASFFAALDRGDRRAELLVREFNVAFPELNQDSVMSTYAVMKVLHK